MKTLLQIDSSIHSDAGQSTRLAGELTRRWLSANSGGRVIVRDLARDPVPHLTAERFQAFLARAEERTPAQRQAVAYSDALIEELRQADAIVIAAPMYNFDAPSTLKAYFDHVARAGVTFRYTDRGAVGLLTGKKAYVVAARGGKYAGTAADHHTAYIRQFLGFLGITDVEFVYAEVLALGDAARDAGLARARATIARLAVDDREPLAA